jgi:hypothetical protein
VISIADAKHHCGYNPKPTPPQCGNCDAFRSDFVYPGWVKGADAERDFDARGYAKVEKAMRCADHGFATKKTATCRLWKPAA